MQEPIFRGRRPVLAIGNGGLQFLIEFLDIVGDFRSFEMGSLQGSPSTLNF